VYNAAIFLKKTLDVFLGNAMADQGEQVAQLDDGELPATGLEAADRTGKARAAEGEPPAA